MATMITQREQLAEPPSTAVLRIMRFLPVTIPMALHIEPTVSSGPSRGKRGGRVTVGGTVKAGGFGARLTYRRVERGTSLPLEETSSERIALLHDRSLPIQPRPIDRAELERPPDLWIHYVDRGGAPLTPRERLGRCDQGPFDLNPCLPLNLFVDAIVVKGEMFDLNPLSELAISGDVSIRSGIAARLTMTNGDPSSAHPSDTDTSVDVPLIPADTLIHLPRRPLRSPLGRDSWIYLAFLDGTGQITGGESLLGRAQPSLAEMQNGHTTASISTMEPAYPVH
jgi:hypothetical protein